MILRPMVPLVLAAVVLTGVVQPAGRLQAQNAPSHQPLTINGVPDTGQYIPGDAILAKVDDRAITAREFVDAYFNSLIEYRPKADSAGLHEFLNSMVNKEVLARLASKVDKPMTFEDRHELRTHGERVLSNVLFQRMVLDSIHITRADVARAHEQFMVQIRLRQIVVPDEASAGKIRLELIRGKIGWKEAVKKYSTQYSDQNPEGEIGWKLRAGFDAITGEQIFTLKPGEISTPVEFEDGYHLLQCMERRPYGSASLEALYVQIEDQLRNAEISRRSGKFREAMARQVSMRYDTTAIRNAASQFPAPRTFGGGALNFDTRLPEFPASDTSKVLATWDDGGALTLGAFLHAYQDISPLMRPAVDTFQGMLSQIQTIALEPYRVRVARAMGLERDSMATAMMKKRIEQMRVEKMYQDSVLSKVWVSSDERRAYYDAHLTGFITYPKAHYVVIRTPRRSHADSLAARIRGGESATDVLAAALAAGAVTGAEEERQQNEPGPFHNIIFGQLQDGETTVVGPDEAGQFLVIHLIEQDSGRQLSFSEAQVYVDESLQNIKSEALLNELIARHRGEHDIVEYPERLMRVRMVDPVTEPSR